MPESLLSAIHLVLHTRDVRIARLNPTNPKTTRGKRTAPFGATAGIGAPQKSSAVQRFRPLLLERVP
jgi:hypothetical protein